MAIKELFGRRQFLKDWTPPALVRIVKNILKIGNLFEGDYSSWEQAQVHSTGYDLNEIFQRVRDASLKVRRGDAVFERDSVCFYHEEYCWPLLAGLLWCASISCNRLNLLDFGGSLGSSYFQYRKLLKHLDEVSWSIVEQEHFVSCGRELFEDQSLKFYFTIDACIKDRNPDILLLGSVVQYLERPYDFIREIIKKEFSIIIFDRTPFLTGDRDRLTVQKVPSAIYPASYPAWFLCQYRFEQLMSEHYDLIASFNNDDLSNISAQFKGFIYKRRS